MTKSEDLSIKLWHYISATVMPFLVAMQGEQKNLPGTSLLPTGLKYLKKSFQFPTQLNQLHLAIMSALKFVSILKGTVFSCVTGRSQSVQRSAKHMAHSFLFFFVLHIIVYIREKQLNVLSNCTSCFM